MSFALGPFTPAKNGTTTVGATTTTASGALKVPSARDQVMVTNAAGGSTAFIEFGDSTVTASATTSTPVLPGAAYIFTINPEMTHIAVITGTGTATVYATVGQGA